MNKDEKLALFAMPVVILAGLGIALAGSQSGVQLYGMPVFGLIVVLVFLIQWIAFIPAYVFQTEKFFDIIGSLTYIAVACIAFAFSPGFDTRTLILLCLVLIWASRLGIFLFMRVHKAGMDSRFNELKPSFLRFLNAWSLQGLWVTITISAALAAFTSENKEDFGWVGMTGLLIWILGFSLELIADMQKSRFKSKPENKDQFISSGLWSVSRHPNYLGEILLWVGITIIAVPVLNGWQWITLISPVFVCLLLIKISGIPILEKRADQKWGGQENYEMYKTHTPVLLPHIKIFS